MQGTIHKTTILLAVLAMLPAREAASRLDPLKQTRAPSVRPEVVIVLDLSGSMDLPATCSWANVSGSDCGGARTGTVDLCGDGLCSGLENSSSCASDCNIADNNTPNPGSAPACKNDASSCSKLKSRTFLVKRVLRNLLPDLRESANFGLVGFSKQTGYYQYFKATGAPTKKVTVYLTRREMAYLGAWDSGAMQPNSTFNWNGTPFELLSIAGLTEDKDSLYSRSDDSSEEKRFKFSIANLQYDDGGFTWKYRGSYFTYEQQSIDTATSQVVTSSYMGPQYVSGLDTWVYRRFRWNVGDSQAQGITYTSADESLAMLLEGLEYDQSQTGQDALLHKILGRMNFVTNGGLLANAFTPSGPAIDLTKQHFLDRHNGTGPFAGFTPPADPARDCRKRFVLFLSDGEHNKGGDPWLASASLYNNATFSGNEIKTLVVGIPGLSSGGQTELNKIADGGDDGNYSNGSAQAYLPTTEDQLVNDIRAALAAAIPGDYVTGAAGASTSGSTTTTGDWAILPSTVYPSWEGHLRAFDMTQNPPVEEWDAATELNNLSNPYTRSIYTGHPNIDNGDKRGDPVELLNNTGALINAAKVQEIALAAGSPTVAGLGASAGGALELFLQWLYGQGQTHRLGPVVRCTPATIGPPSESYDALKDHAAFTSANASRETLIYVTSNDGLIHAFRAGKQADGGGTEVFAFIAPNLLDKAYALYLAGGQDASPDNFKWILAGSPRVDDVLGEGDDEGTGWFTQLVVAMGPHNHGMVVLDITNPTDTTLNPIDLRTRPFNVRALHYTDGAVEKTAWNGGTAAAPAYLGEAWSVPSLYWVAATNPDFHMSAGTGYGAPTSSDKYMSTAKGHYYLWWKHGHHVGKHTIGDSNIPKYLHDPGGLTLKVDAAVLADSAAAMDDDSDPKTIIATYQADLEGRIVRFPLGDPASPWVMVGPDTSNPLYYSPAVMHLGSKQVVLAFNSGSADEASPPTPTDIESTIYLRSETNGTMDYSEYNLTCLVSDIQTGCGGDLDITGATWTEWPTAAAKPVGTPLLVYNDPGIGAERVEAFYLLYEPSSTGGSCTSGAGTSWMLRISVDSTGTANTLEDVSKIDGRAGGMTLLGGGTQVAVSKSATGAGTSATMDNLNNPVSGSAGGTNPASLEYWREVK